MTTPKKKPSRTNAVRGKHQMNVYITPESREVLRLILERDGVPYSAQVERAIKLWAVHKGIGGSHAAGEGTTG